MVVMVMEVVDTKMVDTEKDTVDAEDFRVQNTMVEAVVVVVDRRMKIVMVMVTEVVVDDLMRVVN